MRGGVGQFARRAVEDDAAGRHADQAVAIAARQFERVQVADHGDAVVAVDALQRVHDDAGVARIERGDRLVGQNDLRLLHQRARDGDALLLAARQAVGALGGEPGDVELFERRQRDRDILLGPELQDRAQRGDVIDAADQDVGQHVEPADQIELLKNHRTAAAPARQRASRQRRHVDVAAGDAAGGRPLQAVDHAQQRRLARSRSSDHADESARRDRQRDFVDGGFGPESAREFFDNEHAAVPSPIGLAVFRDSLVTRGREASRFGPRLRAAGDSSALVRLEV